MADRVPLEQTQDVPVQQDAPSESRTDFVDKKGITEMQDLKTLSLVLGFDGHGFNGDDSKAERIYAWAKDRDGDPLTFLSDIVRKLGITSTKGNLLNKLHEWTSLDTSIKSLTQRKLVLEK